MPNEVVNVDGEDVIVREDTAKKLRGVHWALISIGAMVLIAGFLFVLFFAGAAKDGSIQSPSELQNSNAK